MVTTRDSSGALISRYQASSQSDANNYVQRESQQIQQEIQAQKAQAEKRTAEQAQPLSQSQGGSSSSNILQSTRTPVGSPQIGSIGSPFNDRVTKSQAQSESVFPGLRQAQVSQARQTGISSLGLASAGISSNELGVSRYKAPESRYSKADKALLGFLPGGVTPEEQVPKTLKSLSPLKRAASRTAAGVLPGGQVVSYLEARPKIASTANKVLTPLVSTVLLSKEFANKQASNQFEFIKSKYQQGKIPISTLKAANYIYGKGFSEGIIRDKPLEQSISPGIKNVRDSVFGFTQQIKNKPYEFAEAGVQTYYQSKLLATGAEVGIKKVSDALGLGSKASFYAVNLPTRYLQTEALYSTTEKTFKGKGFSDDFSKKAAFGATVLQAEGFGNIEGAKEIQRLGVVDSSLSGKQRFWQGFKRKVRPGAAEGVGGTLAYLNYKGEQNVLSVPGINLDVSLGGKQLPSYGKTNLPAIDTTKDPRYKTETKNVSRTEFDEISKQLEGKKYSRNDLKNFTNTNFNIQDNGTTTETATYSLNLPAETRRNLNLGKVVPSAVGGAAGMITAGLFGGGEAYLQKTKGGRALTEALGYGTDLPEAPGDFATDVGFGTAFKGTPTFIGKSKPTITITQEIGNFANLGEFKNQGGTLTRTDAKIKGADFSAEISQRKVEIKPRASSFDFGLGGSSKTKSSGKAKGFDVANFRTNDIIKSSGSRGSRGEPTVPSLSGLPGGKPAKLSANNLNLIKDTVKSPAKADTRITGIADTPSKDVVNIYNNTNNSVKSLTNNFASANTQSNANTQSQANTNVFTGKFPFVLPGGGGGRGYKPKKKGKKRTLSYLPSIAALGLGIKGKKSGGLTGLEVRAINY